MKHITMYMAVIAVLLLSCNTGSNKKCNLLQTMHLISKPDGGKAELHRWTPLQALHIFRILLHHKVKQLAYEDWDKKIIKTAEVILELKDYSGYNQTMHKGLKAYGAYIATEEQSLAMTGIKQHYHQSTC
jgi:hypothetical protein